MKTNDKVESKKKEDKPQQRPYEKPRLSVFGDLATLTKQFGNTPADGFLGSAQEA